MRKASGGVAMRQGPRIGTHSKPIARRPAAERTLDGIVFDSVFEMKRWASLKLKETVGHIRNLKRQVPFSLVVNGVEVGRPYRLDFQYEAFVDGEWRTIYEEAKEFDTDVQKLRRKVVEALHSIRITLRTTV